MPSTHIGALRALLEREKGVLVPGAPSLSPSLFQGMEAPDKLRFESSANGPAACLV